MTPPSIQPFFPPQLTTAIITLTIAYLIFEIWFFFHYHYRLLPTANNHHRIRFSEAPANYRDYPNVADRAKLLSRIIDRLGKRMSPSAHSIQAVIQEEKSSSSSSSQILFYNFIESWFIKKDINNNDEIYEKFSHQFDEATFDVGFCPPPPLMIRMAWSSSLGSGSSTSSSSSSSNHDYYSSVHNDGESSNKTECSSSESLDVLEQQHQHHQHQHCHEPTTNNNYCHTKENETSKSMGGGGSNPNQTTSSVVASSSSSPPSKNQGKLQKENMNEFLSWAFFGVHYSTVQSTPEMSQSLNEIYHTLQTRANLTFQEGKNPNFIPRCFTLEKVNSLYRPYGVYASVKMMRWSANCLLYILGFRRYTCVRGLRYWHRPPLATIVRQQNDDNNNNKQPHHHNQPQSPFLFFHGIAPGGYAPYLPMIFLGMLKDQTQYRDVFFFENKPISYDLCLDALSEEDTVHGVLEAMHQHLDGNSNAKQLILCGHSFGSCQLTWMVKNLQMRDRIHSLILLDPVSILLSEPDVMINFLYTRPEKTANNNKEEEEESYVCPDSLLGKFIRFINETKIHLVASSELFIEHYLRRNFAWYNSELWLEDIPPHVKVLVCLAELDEIVNCKKVVREIVEHNRQVNRSCVEDDDNDGDDERLVPNGPNVDLILWKDVGHAHVVSNPQKWGDVRGAMERMGLFSLKVHVD